MNKKRIILIAVAAVIIVGGGVWLFGGAKAKHKVTYATATIHKGEISESVTATGTIEPVTEVEVGTQVSGIIDKIHVDYNSVVTKGQHCKANLPRNAPPTTVQRPNTSTRKNSTSATRR